MPRMNFPAQASLSLSAQSPHTKELYPLLSFVIRLLLCNCGCRVVCKVFLRIRPLSATLLNNELQCRLLIMCNRSQADPWQRARNNDYSMQIPPADLSNKVLFDMWDSFLIILETEPRSHMVIC